MFRKFWRQPGFWKWWWLNRAPRTAHLLAALTLLALLVLGGWFGSVYLTAAGAGVVRQPVTRYVPRLRERRVTVNGPTRTVRETHLVPTTTVRTRTQTAIVTAERTVTATQVQTRTTQRTVTTTDTQYRTVTDTRTLTETLPPLTVTTTETLPAETVTVIQTVTVKKKH